MGHGKSMSGDMNFSGKLKDLPEEYVALLLEAVKSSVK